MTNDELDQLEAGLVRLRDGVCVASDLEVAAADAIAKLRAELAAANRKWGEQLRVAHQERGQARAELAVAKGGFDAAVKDTLKYRGENETLRALLREARAEMENFGLWSPLRARIDAALGGEDGDS